MRLGVVAAAALVLAAPAVAADVSPGELRALARRAASDPAALERLRAVDSVGGRRVDLRRALRGADRDELARRLATIARSEPSRRASASRARADARRILAQRRYRESELPRPLHGVLVWIGERLEPVERLIDRIPGPPALAWTVIGALVVALAVVLALRLARRRSAEVVTATRGRRLRPEDPRRLEHEAAEAERRGELERALRLLFRAGLLRLDRAGAIRFRESLTSGDVARRLRSADFRALAAAFDEIVYGRRPPQPEDVTAARESWRRVLEAATA